MVSSPRGRTRMVAHKTVDELHDELLRADDDLERLRREAAHLRRELAERREAPRDPELSVALTAAEGQEAIIAWLEARREKLQRQLTGV